MIDGNKYDEDLLGELYSYENVNKQANRINCAKVGIIAIKKAVFDEKLSDSNLFISDAWHEKTLGKTELHFVKKGTYHQYLEMKKNEGANLNQLKPVVLLNTQDKRDFFWKNVTD